jgi:hypothetical protein
MNVKAQGLLNAAAHLEEVYGRDTLGQILRDCRPDTRERYMTATAIEWHPVEEFTDLLDQAERHLGTGNGRIAQELGAAGARRNMSGFLRKAAFYLARPDYALRRVAGAWSQFNDEGQMEIREATPGGCVVEVSGIGVPDPLFCAALTGWVAVLAERIGAPSPRATHPECLGRGGARCVWRASWQPIEIEPNAPSSWNR